MTEIHVAYSIGRRGGTHYRARAHALDMFDGRPVKHSLTVCLEDDAESAMAGAVEYIRAMYRREGLPVPRSVYHHGRVPRALLDVHAFGGQA